MSVIIPTFNRAVLVLEAIRSVQDQTYSDWEIVVVDDGSTDRTSEALAEAARDRRVRVVTQSNAGVAAARNHGASVSHGEFLAFLDSDDQWEPAKLERQVARLGADPAAVLCFCWCVAYDEEGRVREVFRPTADDALDRLIMRGNVFPGGASSALVRRTAFEKVGGFDTALQFSADWDLWIRLAAEGQVCVVPQFLVRYLSPTGRPRWDAGVVERDFRRLYAKVAQMPGIAPRLRKGGHAARGLLSVALYRARKGQWASGIRIGVEAFVRSPLRTVAAAGELVRRRRERRRQRATPLADLRA